MTYTNAEKAAEAKRELGMRRTVYGRQLADGRMTQSAHDYRIGVMEEIAEEYAAKAKADERQGTLAL